MEIFQLFWSIFQFIIGFHLVFPIILFIFWKCTHKKQTFSLNSLKENEADYAIIVTAYEETSQLHSVVNSILKLNYSNYLVYIVADNCNIDNLFFESDKVILLRPEEVIASNTGSHEYAVDHFVRNHDRVTIIDSDNLVDAEYLNALNNSFNQGFSAVQGIRLPKNLDTTVACLDGARDIYYHFYDGKLLYEVGSSATLAGSGMAFDKNLYTQFLKSHKIKGAGFDKILQNYLVSKNLRIKFEENAFVFDEKTSKSEQLVKQRARWINTWFKYFKFGFVLIAKGIKNLSLNQFLFGLVLLRPPLFLFIIGSGLCFLINLFINPTIAAYWFIAFVLFIIGFFIALLNSDTDSRIYKSLKNIPMFMFWQVKSLLKSKNANKHSVATKHFHSDIEK